MASDSAARRPILALAPRLRGRVAGILGVFLLGLVALWLIENLAREPKQFALVLGAGLTNGSIYALVALGYTLVYGILELINFAHGDVFMLGGMLTATLVASLGLAAGDAWYVLLGGILLMLIAAMAFCGLLNASIERIALPQRVALISQTRPSSTGTVISRTISLSQP